MAKGSTISIVPNSKRLSALFLVLAIVAITNQRVLQAFHATSIYSTLGLAIFYVVNVAFVALFCGHGADHFG